MYRNVYELYIQSVNTLQVRMSSSGIVIHYIDEISPLTPRKYTVFNRNFVFHLHSFDLHKIIQECNPGIKQDLPALGKCSAWLVDCTPLYRENCLLPDCSP